MSSPPRIDLSNFLNDEYEDSKYVLTSPRSLQACKKIGIRPNELLPRALAQVEADINKHYNSQGGSEYLPTREDCSGGKGELTSETCYAVWEELERERCGKLEQTRRERDQIIIEAYHNKKRKEGKGGKKSNSSTPIKREERHAPLRSESNPDLISSDDSAQLDTRSLLVRPSSAQRHWSSVSHKQTLRTPQAKRDRLSASVPRSEKRVVKSMLERSLEEEEYSHALRSYWDSLWRREQAETSLDRIRREDCHRQHLSSVHSWYERERHLSRLDRDEEERGRGLRESEDRHRSALEISSRQKRQEAELARLDRGVKKRLQEQRLRASQLQSGKNQESLGACLDQSSLRAEESRKSCVREQVRRSGHKNALWAAKSRRAQHQAAESEDRDRGRSETVLEDKLASADLRKLMQGGVSQGEREESKEREYLKRFQQQLSLRQQQSDREEWVQQEEEKRRERELWAEKRAMEGLLSRSRTTSEKRRSRTRSQQGNIAQVREDELVWRSLVAQDLEEKEERVNRHISARSLVAKENREIANITELLRDSIKERSGKKGFQDMVKSTEQFHRIGYGPRGFQKNVSYSHLIS